jgi:hypothetical protein
MARLKLKQVLSNLHYNAADDQLILSGSKVPTGLQNWEDVSGSWDEALGTWDGSRANIPDFVIYGSTFVTSSAYTTGSITIDGVDTFGDSGSFDTIDLGTYD